MDTIMTQIRSLRHLIRWNADWLVTALALLVALYCGSYVMLRLL